jgi:UDP-glucose 4-epimerase
LLAEHFVAPPSPMHVWLAEELDAWHSERGGRINVIGPRETNPHLLPDIIEQLTVTDGRLELGNLLPTRDYIYVDDVSDGLVRLLESDVRGSVNVGTGAAYSAREMVGEIEVILGRSLEVVSVPERQRLGDRPVLLADNSLLRELGWQPAGDFRESLRKTLAAYELTSVS